MFMPKAYEGTKPYIFVSYAHLDSDRVLPIIHALQNRGFRVWYDAGIEAGTEWPEYIATRLDGCTCFLAFVSKNAADSHNCRREINFAIELRKDPLTIYLEDVELTRGMRMQLGTLQAMFYNRHSNMDTFLDALVSSRMLAPCKGAEPATNAPNPTACAYTPHADPEQLFADGYRSEAAGDYQKAFDSYKKAAELGHSDALGALGTMYTTGNGPARHTNEVVKRLRMEAEKGHIMSQLALGIMYYDGKGVPQDLAESVKWYRMAAENGLIPAQLQLANLYWMQAQFSQLDSSAFSLALANMSPPQAQLARNIRNQLSSTVNGYSEAIKFYRMAAENGSADAQLTLGNLFFQGTGVTKDYSEAMKWYRLAAQQGQGGAQCMLGHMYAMGLGVTQNSDESARWYSMAAMWCQTAALYGNVDAQYHLAYIYDRGYGVLPNQNEAVRWYRTAAENGHPMAQFELGFNYRFGFGIIAKDDYEAVKWFRMAAQNGNAHAQNLLASMYQRGEGTVKDWAEAAKWYRMAAQNGHPDAPERLGYLYEYGDLSLEKNYAEAAKWYLKAADNGHTYSLVQLGRLYYFGGPGLKQDYSQAAAFYRMAAEKGDGYGQCSLAEMYADGKGVEKDGALALHWFRKSADRGNTSGQEGMGRCYEEGLGVPIDLETALEWYEMADSQYDIDRVKKAIEANAAAKAQMTYWCFNCGRSFNASKTEGAFTAKCPHCGGLGWKSE